jgi:uncharacterized C2H2 Zn-finger protein
METKPVREPFQCKKCDYVTSRKSSYDRHNLSRKHTSSETETKVRTPMSCMKCGKEFKSRSGYWKHNKDCKVTKPQSLQKAIEVTAELAHVIVKQQEENQKEREESQKEKEILMNQIKLQQDQLNELIPRIGNVINIQVFLNETCKDAVNWNDFIKSLPHSTNITKTICDGIEELGMYKRPVHCFEEKQLCIKHENVWEHDMTKINATMVQTNDTMKQQWERNHPEWYNNAKETEEYTHLFQKEIRTDNLTTFTV